MQKYYSFTLKCGRACEIIDAGSDMIDELLKLEDASINRETFATITKDELEDSILNDRVFVAICEGEPIAFAIVVKNRESERSLAKDAGLPIEDVASFDGVIVAPEHRGNGLQKIFLSLAEIFAKGWGAKRILATVAEANAHSRKNFRDMKYDELCVIPKYGSTRILLSKAI